MDKLIERAKQHMDFYRHLDEVIKKAGGTGADIFTDDEIAKMMVVFAHNDIMLVYRGRSNTGD